MRAGNNIHTNTFQGYTTIVLEIEDNIYGSDIPKIRKMFADLSVDGKITHETPHTIVNKGSEDHIYGWRFVVLSNQPEKRIQTVISNIAEILA